VTDRDPLLSPSGSDLPPAPPIVPPIVRVDSDGKHAGPLMAPDGIPIPPTVTSEELHHLIQRVGRDVILLAIGFVVVGLVALGAGWVALDTRSYANEIDTRLSAINTERVRVDGLLQHSQCETLRAMRTTYSTAGRDAWPGGTGSYDAFFAELFQAAAPLNCVGG
jgi:hypothetical protein